MTTKVSLIKFAERATVAYRRQAFAILVGICSGIS